jgi:amino acid transporter
MLMGVGAVVSIAGVYQVFTLGLARLSYAMAVDGLLPAPLARVDRNRGTPFIGLLFQAACALAMVFLFKISLLITAAIFFLGVCYVATAFAAIRLIRQHPDHAVRLPGLRVWLFLAALAGFYLSTQTSTRVKALGCLLMLAGAVLNIVRGRAWRRASSARAEERRLEDSTERRLREGERWLHHFARRTNARR